MGAAPSIQFFSPDLSDIFGLNCVAVYPSSDSPSSAFTVSYGFASDDPNNFGVRDYLR